MILDSVIEAETSVLGAILLESRVMDELISVLDTSDFTIETHRLIWRSMKYLYQKNEPIDIVTTSAILDKYKKIDHIGGVSYLSNLAQSCPTTANSLHYAEIIKRDAVKRKGLQFAEDIKRLTNEDQFDTPEEYLMMIDSLFTHMRPDATGKLKSFSETEEEYFEFLTSKTENILTGFGQFDEWSGGIGKGWLYVLAGRPSIGKTAKALQMAVNIARQNVGDILVWSQEMTFSQLKNRMLSLVSSINYTKIRKKELEPFEIDLVKKAYREISKLPLYVEDSSGVTIDHIRATARQISRRREIGAIFVDYLTRMDIRQDKGQTWSRAVGEVAKSFKWLAREMNCPVILLAQLNREGADKEPRLQDLRDSGEVEQEADVVEFLWQNPEEISPDGIIVQSTIAKGRDIGTNRFKYLFKGWIQKYEDYKEVRYESVAHIQSHEKRTSRRKISY